MFIRFNIDKRLLNVTLLGICFMVLFSSYNTMSNMEKLVLASIHDEKPEFNGDGYISLCITYAAFAISLWLAPSVISVTGPRAGMTLGAVGYSVFIASFYTESPWMIYVGSGIVGLCASILWTGQGNYLIINSDPDTINRKSAMFWVLFMLASFFGNVFVYFAITQSTITATTRYIIITGLLVTGILAIILLSLLRPAIGPDGQEVPSEKSQPLGAFKRFWEISTSKHMMILAVTFCYIGLQLSFALGIYTSCIGFTLQLGSDSKKLAPLVGMFIGLGELLGGGSQVVAGKTISDHKWGRSFVLLTGIGFQMVLYLIAFLNLPNSSVFGDTNDKAIIQSSSFFAILGSFFLGIGESCFTPQIYALLSIMYPDDSAQSVAFYTFIYSTSTAISFFYSTFLGLYTQLAILTITGLCGAIAFCYVDQSVYCKRQPQEKQCGLENTQL